MKTNTKRNAKEPDNRPKVLHLLEQSFPNISGYSIRSHFILSTQKAFARPYALTIPYFKLSHKHQIINGVIYLRYPKNILLNLLYNSQYAKRFKTTFFFNLLYFSLFKTPSRFIQKLVKSDKIDLIHAYTPYKFASIGEKVAHKMGIPFIYEVRGFLEDSKVGYGYWTTKENDYIKTRIYETELMKKADIVVTLGKMMKKEINRRGIENEKIVIVPNGVDTNYFTQDTPNLNLKLKLKVDKKKLIAYVGNIRRIEGIEILIKALKIVRNEIKDVELLLIGGGNKEYLMELNKLTKTLKIDKLVHFIGQVHFNEIKNYYSITDLIVIPRTNTRVSRLVTPLKPLEAMSLKKVVITSDLPALRELVKPGISGDLFRAGDSMDLAKKIILYLSEEDKKNKIIESARNYVKNNFDWKIISERYYKLYNQLLN